MNTPATRGAALAYSASVLVASLVLMSSVGTYYTNKRIEDYNETLTAKLQQQQAASDARFCEVLTLGTRYDPAKGPKPTTPRGVDQQKQEIESHEAALRLLEKLGCKQKE
jgi:hypothetical protein